MARPTTREQRVVDRAEQTAQPGPAHARGGGNLGGDLAGKAMLAGVAADVLDPQRLEAELADVQTAPADACARPRAAPGPVVPWKANHSAGSVMDSGATISGTNEI